MLLLMAIVARPMRWRRAFLITRDGFDDATAICRSLYAVFDDSDASAVYRALARTSFASYIFRWQVYDVASLSVGFTRRVEQHAFGYFLFFIIGIFHAGFRLLMPLFSSLRFRAFPSAAHDDMRIHAVCFMPPPLTFTISSFQRRSASAKICYDIFRQCIDI